MAVMRQAITAEEIGRRGEALYNAGIRERVEKGNTGQYLALDIFSGDYEIDASEPAAVGRALERNPDGLFYIVRVGYDVAHYIGTAPSEMDL